MKIFITLLWNGLAYKIWLNSGTHNIIDAAKTILFNIYSYLPSFPNYLSLLHSIKPFFLIESFFLFFFFIPSFISQLSVIISFNFFNWNFFSFLVATSGGSRKAGLASVGDPWLYHSYPHPAALHWPPAVTTLVKLRSTLITLQQCTVPQEWQCLIGQLALQLTAMG